MAENLYSIFTYMGLAVIVITVLESILFWRPLLQLWDCGFESPGKRTDDLHADFSVKGIGFNQLHCTCKLSMIDIPSPVLGEFRKISIG